MPGPPLTLADLVSRRPDPAAPLLTHYDLGTGERVELSGTTTANWVAKTSNFLVDDLDAERGTTIRIGLPTHWLRFVWLLSAWNVGAVVSAGDGAAIGVSGPELEGDEPHRVAASLRPLGARFAEPPAGFLDLGAEVPGHGDHFLALDPPAPNDLAVTLGTAETHQDLLARIHPDPRRVLVEPGPVGRDVDLVIAACLGGGSVVGVTSATPDDLVRVAGQEGAEILDGIV